MDKIKIFLADSQQLIVEGLKAILATNPDFSVCGEASNREAMIKGVKEICPNILIVDFNATGFDLQSLKELTTTCKDMNVLAISSLDSKLAFNGAKNAGVKSFLLKSCDKAEIFDALYATHQGNNFYCSKLLDFVMQDSGSSTKNNTNCDGLIISERESEIIVLIAEGFSNKEIADKLFLSTHTVNTHRKNIMAKLGVNNAAGIVLYAVKENLISPNKFLFSAAG